MTLYPGSSHVHTVGIDRASDAEMREYARRQQFVIVTKDTDFSDLCILLGFPPKVIWIRRGNCSTADIESLLRDHNSDIETLDQDQVMGILTLF
jgi:predicted nuclease of predicted toxin-antitoxin system